MVLLIKSPGDMGTLLGALHSWGRFEPAALTVWPLSSPPVSADLLQELLGWRLPGRRGGNGPNVPPCLWGVPAPVSWLNPVTWSVGWHRRGCRSPGEGRLLQSGVVPGARLPLDMTVDSVHGGFQLSAALRLRLESGSEGSEEEDGVFPSAVEPGQAGGSLA